MINKSFDNLIEQLKAVKLSSEEKSDILARTFSAIDEIESITTPESADKKMQPVTSPYSSAPWRVYFVSRKFVPSLAIILVLFASGGVSLAAENALPGDPLYSLKLNINEKVLGLTAVTPASKAQVAVEATERRLQEAVTLSARGQLSDQAKNILQQQIQMQANEVHNKVASLVSQNDLSAAQDITVDYESSLKAHELILEKISSDSTTSPDVQPLDSLIAAVKTTIATTTVSREGIQQQEVRAASNDPKAVADQKMAEVREQIEDTLSLQAANKDALSTSTAALVAGKIDEAQVLTIKAQGYMDATTTYPDAITDLQHASTLLSDAQSSISTEAGLNADIKKVIGIPVNGQTSTSTATTTVSINGTTTSSTASGTSGILNI